MVVIINIFWFNYSPFLIILNIALLNRWSYFIKSVFDRQLLIVLFGMYFYNLMRLYFLNYVYVKMIEELFAVIIPYKKNLFYSLSSNL